MGLARLLVVEDDMDIANMLKIYFTGMQYDVDVAHRGRDALEKVKHVLPHLIVLDIMLPDIDGYEVCRNLRTSTRTSHIPVIFLTQKDERSDRLQGLELGADDYITKPFSPRALVARIRAMLRRTRGEIKTPAVIRVGALEVDSEKHTVTYNNKPIQLTPNEFKLLTLLANRPGQTLTREQLLDDLHGGASSIDRSVDSHIKNLRRKLEAESKISLIEAVYGIGYRYIIV